MSEIKEYKGKIYRKVPDASYYRCYNCCFWCWKDYGKCFAPDGFNGCHSECFHWKEVDNRNKIARLERQMQNAIDRLNECKKEMNNG